MSRIEELCALACREGASDLFLGEEAVPRLRLDGTVAPCAGQPPLTREDLETFWALCEGSPAAQGEQDTHFTDASGRRFRVNLHRHLGRLGAVLRPVRSEIPDLDSLGLPADLLRRWVSQRAGLILVTGPTGSGKSTTVAALLEWMNRTASRHVVTIEDPIEYLFVSRRCLFTQREVPRDTPSFAAGLRSGLRQSPDVLFVGEIRDFETASTALQAAETGHLVLSTLHSATVSESLERLVHLLPQPLREGSLALLAQQLLGILSQKLLPGLTGGRILVTESCTNAGATRDWIRRGDAQSLADFLQRGGNPENRDFHTALVEAVRNGRLAEETALQTAARPSELRRALLGVSDR